MCDKFMLSEKAVSYTLGKACNFLLDVDEKLKRIWTLRVTLAGIKL